MAVEQATTAGSVRLTPVSGRARIEVLDILRGLAILGIFYMNIPFMGGTLQAEFVDPRLGGWRPADQWTWSIIQIVMDGTQRGTLEMLFGAGMMILTARAMTPDGPVAVADLYMRRTLWLLVFGLADIFLLGWVGDILNIYALASLFLFPFRKLAARTLLGLGLLFSVFGLATGIDSYVSRATLIDRAEAAQAAQAQHLPLRPDQTEALTRWREASAALHVSAAQKQEMRVEIAARRGGVADYLAWLRAQWFFVAAHVELLAVAEAFSTMLIGIALFKWGFIQGGAERRTYLLTAITAYALGCGARAIGVHERLSPVPVPSTFEATGELARLAVTIGHIALVNLLAQTRAGRALLHPFAAAGRTAFSLYFCETIIGMWILFPGFGLGLWDHFGWFGLAVTATVTLLGLIVLTNLYSRFFAMGPLEWAWRSLAYCKLQRFRRHGGPPAEIVVGP